MNIALVQNAGYEVDDVDDHQGAWDQERHGGERILEGECIALSPC